MQYAVYQLSSDALNSANTAVLRYSFKNCLKGKACLVIPRWMLCDQYHPVTTSQLQDVMVENTPPHAHGPQESSLL